MKAIFFVLFVFLYSSTYANIIPNDTITIDVGELYKNERINLIENVLNRLIKIGYQFNNETYFHDSFIEINVDSKNSLNINVSNKYSSEQNIDKTINLIAYNSDTTSRIPIKVKVSLHNYSRVKTNIKSKTINDTTLSLIMSYQNLSRDKVIFKNYRKTILIIPPFGKIEKYKIDIPLLCKDYAYIHNVFPENYKIKINKLNYYFSGVNDKLIDFDSLTTPCNPIFYSDSIGYNFGKREIGSTIEGVIKYKNIGNAPLLITTTASSCGCFDIKPRRSPLEPGGIDSIYFKYGHIREGKFIKTITVGTNDPNNRYISFHISVLGIPSNIEK